MVDDKERARRLELASSIEWEIGANSHVNYNVGTGLAKDFDMRASAAEAVLEDLRVRYPDLEEWSKQVRAAAIAAAALDLAKEVEVPRAALTTLNARADSVREELDRLSLPHSDNPQRLLAAYATLLRISVAERT